MKQGIQLAFGLYAVLFAVWWTATEADVAARMLVTLICLFAAGFAFGEVLRWLKTPEKPTERKGETASETRNDMACEYQAGNSEKQ